MRPERDTVLHSWCRQADWQAPTVVGGEGAWLLTADGRRILDLSSQAECSNLGHQHPHVVQAIRAQAERLCFVTAAWGAEPRAALAERLLDKAVMAEGRVFFTLAGADANENAVKFARWASGRPAGRILTRHRSYHGATHAAMALSGDTRAQGLEGLGLEGVVKVQPPDTYRSPFGGATEAEEGRRAAAHVGDVLDCTPEAAAVLMEPDAGTNGIVPADTWWPALREETRRRGVLLIADEVMSGFGRVGEWFAWQRHGETGRPDLFTLAKGLTGAHLPLGAVVVDGPVARALEARTLLTGLTYCGHPLSCAAALGALDAYEEGNLIARSRALGAELFTSLKDLQTRHVVIGDVRGGRGLWAVLELVEDRATKAPLSPWDAPAPALKHLVARALEEGVSLAMRGNLLFLAPPLVISETDLSSAVALLDRLFAECFPGTPA